MSSSRALLNIGHGNFVLSARVIAVMNPSAAPMKRLRDEAAKRGKLVDSTSGRRTRSILLMDSDHVILSAINPETIAARFVQDDAAGGAEEA